MSRPAHPFGLESLAGTGYPIIQGSYADVTTRGFRLPLATAGQGRAQSPWDWDCGMRSKTKMRAGKRLAEASANSIFCLQIFLSKVVASPRFASYWREVADFGRGGRPGSRRPC